ncbi:MAG: anthranilate synthase component I [Chloroflexota bacterium]
MTTSTNAPLPTISPPRRGALSPTLDEVRALATHRGDATTIPLTREMMADLETPVSAYLKLVKGNQGFLLESIEGGERLARYSVLGTDPLAVLTLQPGSATVVADEETNTVSCADPLTAIADLTADHRSMDVPGSTLPRFSGGAVGYLSYEAIRAFEPRVSAASGIGLGLPMGTFMLVDGLLVFDHIARTVKIVSHVRLDDPRGIDTAYAEASRRIDTYVARLRAPLPAVPHGGTPEQSPIAERATTNTTESRFHEMVARAKEYIAAGDIFQVVLSQRTDVRTPVHPFTIYRALSTINPSPYMFYLYFLDHQIIGASPELLVRLEDGVVTNHPIAGTRPRGATPEADLAYENDLLADEKERAEHIMLVDLGRNDVGRVSKPGTVRVPRLMQIERYSHVMHIVSNVEGDIEPNLTGLDALRACFPAGTVSGAPKVRAMEIIGELEADQRGPYSGAVGYVDFSGGMDTCIALRTMVFKDGVASLQAGAGIVADSTPEGEYAECHHKMRGSMRALELAEDMEAADA